MIEIIEVKKECTKKTKFLHKIRTTLISLKNQLINQVNCTKNTTECKESTDEFNKAIQEYLNKSSEEKVLIEKYNHLVYRHNGILTIMFHIAKVWEKTEDKKQCEIFRNMIEQLEEIRNLLKIEIEEVEEKNKSYED